MSAGRSPSPDPRAERKGLPEEHIRKLKAQLVFLESLSPGDRRRLVGSPREARIVLGDKPFHMVKEKAQSEGKTARVSTYGMSDPTAPVIFDQWIEDIYQPTGDVIADEALSHIRARLDKPEVIA